MFAKRYNTRIEALRAARARRRGPQPLDYIFTGVTVLIVFGLYINLQDYVIGRVVTTEAQAEDVSVAATFPTPNATSKPQVVDIKTPEDERAIAIEAFLLSKQSPLADYAEFIVAEADKYDIGWTTIVAISGMESDYGRKVPAGSHNAWGLGGSNFMYFDTWENGIRYVSRLLGTSYKTNEVRGIQLKYCPVSECNPNWTSHVVAVSNAILNIK